MRFECVKSWKNLLRHSARGPIIILSSRWKEAQGVAKWLAAAREELEQKGVAVVPCHDIMETESWRIRQRLVAIGFLATSDADVIAFGRSDEDGLRVAIAATAGLDFTTVIDLQHQAGEEETWLDFPALATLPLFVTPDVPLLRNGDRGILERDVVKTEWARRQLRDVAQIGGPVLESYAFLIDRLRATAKFPNPAAAGVDFLRQARAAYKDRRYTQGAMEVKSWAGLICAAIQGASSSRYSSSEIAARLNVDTLAETIVSVSAFMGAPQRHLDICDINISRLGRAGDDAERWLKVMYFAIAAAVSANFPMPAIAMGIRDRLA